MGKIEITTRKFTFIRSCGDILYNLMSLVSRSIQQRNSILASVLSEYLLLLIRYLAHRSMASNLKEYQKFSFIDPFFQDPKIFDA